MSLIVVCSHFNPAGYHIVRRNLMRFVRQLTSQRVSVYTVELAYEKEPFFTLEIESGLRLRTSRANILWHKENLINLAVRSLPKAYDYVAWIDPDLLFLEQSWAIDTNKALERWPVVQLFDEAAWTNNDGGCYKRAMGAVAAGSPQGGTPGFAWASRRDLWTVGTGLPELAILGGGDALFAGACLNAELPAWLNYPKSANWMGPSAEWVALQGGCGVVKGTVVHEWHGQEAGRDYRRRHELVKDLDIEHLVHRRHDGLLQFTAGATDSLRTAFASYFANRKEDG